MIVKKLRSIILPQIFLGIITLVYNILINFVQHNTINFSTVGIISAFGAWFLIVLFFIEIIMVGLHRLVESKLGLPLLIILTFIAFYLCNWNGVVYLQQILCGLFFCLLGFQMRSHLDEYYSNNSKIKGLGWFLLLVVIILSNANEPVGMYINQYGNKIVFAITAFIGILAITDISMSLTNTAFLQWIGRFCIVFYVYQFVVSRFYWSVFMRVLPQYHNAYPIYIISFLLSMITLVPLVEISIKYIPWAFGKSKIKQQIYADSDIR